MSTLSNPFSVALLLASAATASWAAPAGAPASQGVCPLVDLRSGILLGGSVGGRWVRATPLARQMKGGESYRAYSSKQKLGAARGTKPKSEGAPCEDTLFLKVTPGGSGSGEFALGAPWNALPRAPRAVSTEQAAYKAQVAGLLRSQGVARPNVRISQVWRVDLDGDGEAEVLISAAVHQGKGADAGSHLSSASKAGDYSVVLLRKMVRGRLKTLVLAGEYYAQPKTFNAPGVQTVAAMLDVNGDGKMEIVLRGRYYEGEWSSVYELRGDKAVQVLSEGCGA